MMLWILLLLLLINACLILECKAVTTEEIDEFVSKGDELLARKFYPEAAEEYYQALLNSQHSNDKAQSIFTKYLQVYEQGLGGVSNGYTDMALKYHLAGQRQLFKQMLNLALQSDPDNLRALDFNAKILENKSDVFVDDGETLEQKVLPMHNRGIKYFNEKKWEQAAEAFQRACDMTDGLLYAACANAVYCRNSVLDYGEDGQQYIKDMQTVTNLVITETSQHAKEDVSGQVKFSKPISVHPHMNLSYLVPPLLQKFVSAAYTTTEELQARITSNIEQLPPDLPFDYTTSNYSSLADTSGRTKLNIGFVGAGFNSKAVLFLSYKMFEYFDKDRFDVHVFSLDKADQKVFIDVTMRGVDWRQRVIDSIGEKNFHDVMHMRNDHIQLARYIKSHNIHILIDWDGFARQTLRSDGLFPLRPSPIQILHQEFLGTTGAPHIDYIYTDERVSPLHLQNLYTEKFIYMPNHFFSKGHRVQDEVIPPSHEFSPASTPYQLGSGTPQENKCLAGDFIQNDVSFVFCNVHKFLKNNPDTLKSWARILQDTPGSILCLLENPPEGVPYLRKFVADIDPSLNERIHFLEWENNPFDHQRRHGDLCNAVLDTFPYNGHTTTMDALYAGVPVVTRSDGDYMASRVTTSANEVLGIPEMNGNGVDDYVQIATQLATDNSFYNDIRNKLIDSCLIEEPMHPFWDVARYVKDFETGLEMAWERFVSKKKPTHIRISDRTFIDEETEDRGDRDEL